MDQPNHDTNSALTNKRKRGRPRRDESKTPQQLNLPYTTGDENLIGQVVSGVVEGSFEAGYFLNVKVGGTEKQLKGVVFLPDRVTPVTSDNDLFPQAKMYTREGFPVPSFNQQSLPPQNQTVDTVFDPQTNMSSADKIQPAKLNNPPVSNSCVASEAGGESNLLVDTQMKDVGGSSAEEKLAGPEGQTLSLMPQFASNDPPKEDHTVQITEASAASKTVVTISSTSRKDSTAEVSSTFVDFFSAPGTTQKPALGSSSTLSLELFQNETKQSGTEEEKSLAGAGLDRLVDEKQASPADDVPEELQLELGNKNMSGLSIVSATKSDQPASSNSGFSGNISVGREETVKEPNAAGSGFPEAMQVDGKDS